MTYLIHGATFISDDLVSYVLGRFVSNLIGSIYFLTLYGSIKVKIDDREGFWVNLVPSLYSFIELSSLFVHNLLNPLPSIPF